MDACFKTFDKDEDNSLNINEFTALLKALFRNEKGKPYEIDSYMCNELFMIFNQSGDGSMSRQEFSYCWNNWIKKIVRPVSALIVVDVQNDFISGSLSISNWGPAGQNGEEVVAPINKLIDSVPFDLYAYSLDWHPSDHLSFVDNVHNRKLHNSSPIQDPSKASVMDTVVFAGPPTTEQTLWPRHCVQESWGAELHKDLKVHENAFMVKKGNKPDIDSYSAFFDNKKLGFTELESILRNANITDCYVCGIAYDVCVPKESLMVYKGTKSFVESYSSFYDNCKHNETNLKRELFRKQVSDVFICGLATDICVGATALHAQELGFRTILIDDASKGIEMGAIKGIMQRVKENNGIVIDSHEVKALVQGRDRRVELGYQWALQCRKNIVYPPKNKNSKFNMIPGMTNEEAANDVTVTSSSGANKTAVI